jgi:hypothetical protein
MTYRTRVAEAKAQTNRSIQELKELDIRKTWGKPRTRREEMFYLAGVGAFLLVFFLTVAVVLFALRVV